VVLVNALGQGRHHDIGFFDRAWLDGQWPRVRHPAAEVLPEMQRLRLQAANGQPSASATSVQLNVAPTVKALVAEVSPVPGQTSRHQGW
jgi:hypothetical protein